MKQLLRKLFSPLLSPFEKDDGPYHYKPMNRKILLFFAFIFIGLASLVVYVVPEGSEMSYLIPVIVFGGIGFIALIVALLGNERAVAKIWGNK